MIKGSLVALVTPFRDDGIDEAALQNMVQWHIEQGTHGIVPAGTTGESATLTGQEHCRVIELVVQAADGRRRESSQGRGPLASGDTHRPCRRHIRAP